MSAGMVAADRVAADGVSPTDGVRSANRHERVGRLEVSVSRIRCSRAGTEAGRQLAKRAIDRLRLRLRWLVVRVHLRRLRVDVTHPVLNRPQRNAVGGHAGAEGVQPLYLEGAVGG